jgi:hypothetical protein
MPLLTIAETIEKENATRLVVLVHGWRNDPTTLREVRDTVAAAEPQADILLPRYTAGLLSNASPEALAADLADAISSAVAARRARPEGGQYEDIILVGHCLGALLVRKAFVYACGQTQDHPRTSPQGDYIVPGGADWTPCVSRILLLAGMNRGWSLQGGQVPLSWCLWFSILLVIWLSRWFKVSHLINAVRRGTPFITNLRIQWLNLLRRPDSPVPLTIQLLGTEDNLVAQHDSIDVQCGTRFVYRAMPDSNHHTVVRFPDDPTGRTRREIFRAVLQGPADQLLSEYRVHFEPDRTVTDVVFIVHGIRDLADWGEPMANEMVTAGAGRGKHVKCITSDYGYLPLLYFLLFYRRHENVRWFMDQYTDAMARYPNAEISFFGHSFGTYLLASALLHYKACKFHRVIFAGSVVNRDFDWQTFADARRVQALRNYTATSDRVVAIFPAVFEQIWGVRADLGSAGVTGFSQEWARRHQVKYVVGKHGAVLRPVHYPSLADFILGNDDAQVPPTELRNDPDWSVSFGRRFCVAIWLVLLVAGSAAVAAPMAAWLLGGFSSGWAVALGVGSVLLALLEWV